MANEEHLAILKQGVEAWNKWRQDNPNVIPDLSVAYLGESDLIKADLSGANLMGANLSGTDLIKADLSGADLFGANLGGADLSEANLREADLTKANLSGANLSRAELIKANLSGADLNRANLRGAILYEASLTKANLSGADLTKADLRGAKVSEANLRGTNLRGANLNRAELDGAILYSANLRRAILSGADLFGANLGGADLSEAKLIGANLTKADLRGADLREATINAANLNMANLSLANLCGASLTSAALIETNLHFTNLTGCKIFGIAAWKLELENTIQKDLVISAFDEPVITVDNLEVAQFIYLLLNNAKIRNVIDTITSKVVLILGRFTPEQKAVLDAIREELRHRNYLPIIFDFDRPASRDLTETISTLAHMARFVIADLTNAKSLPQELTKIVPDLPSVAIQPIIHSHEYEYSMFEHFRRYAWVLPEHTYTSGEELIAVIPEKIIEPAERKVEELRPKAR